MLLRIRREIFRAGDFETHEIDATGLFRDDICKKYHLDPKNTDFYDDMGQLIKEDVLDSYQLVTAVQKPAEAVSATALVVAFWVTWGLIVGGSIAYAIWNSRERNNAKITYSNSLRGAQNPMRAGGPVGILLGNYRVPLDMAGMVYSSIDNNKQYIHQLFCAGYRPVSNAHSSFYNANCGVVLRKDTSQVDGEYIYGGDGNPRCYKAWIGDTPFGSVARYISISASEEHASIGSFPYYNKRCIENSLSIKMLNGDADASNILQYTASSGCIRIGVCVSAPYGYYKIDDDGNQTETTMHYTVQYRKVGASTWVNFPDMPVNRNVNVNEYRVMHSQTLTTLQDFSVNDRYEVRIINYIDHSNDSTYNTAMIVEFVQYDTVNIAKYLESPDASAAVPVYNSAQYSLVDLKAQATDKLTGYIDQFYVECYLQCRSYNGSGSETSNYWNYWSIPSGGTLDARIEKMSNPASVLLYVLTNKNVNPRALTWTEAQTKIDWIAFRDWYLFCERKHWTCNAWITEDMTIGKLCDLICCTGRAMFRTVNGKYSVMLACEVPYITQMFTPRNAWDMQMTKSFEKPLDAVRVEFVDESTWTEAERTALITVDETTGAEVVVVDEDITDQEDQLQVESFAIWGVTRPQQIADLEAYELLCKRLQIRSYSWKCSLEGLLCAVGDVVYMANDNFLYSLGYGRIKGLQVEDGYVKGVYVDESLGMEVGHTYGITVRQNSSDSQNMFATYQISSIITDEDTFDKGVLCRLASYIPVSSANVEEGNLFMYGDASVEGKKLLVVNIQYDSDRNATIEAVDYIPEIFTSLDGPSWVVPPYVSGISKYGSGVNFARGVIPPSVNNPPTNIYPTDLDIDGQIQGLRYEVEYGLSTSPYEYIYYDELLGDDLSDSYGAEDSEYSEFNYGLEDEAGWSSYYDNWRKGLYVWMRIKTTNRDGIVTYNTPVYCKEITESLINGCTLKIMLTDSDGDGDTHTWERDGRSSSNISVIFKVIADRYKDAAALNAALSAGEGVEIHGYKASTLVQTLATPTPTSTFNNNTKTVTLTYSLSFAKNLDIDSLVINAGIQDTYLHVDETSYNVVTKASETLTAVDVTIGKWNLGALSALPTGIYVCSNGQTYYNMADIPVGVTVSATYSYGAGDYFLAAGDFTGTDGLSYSKGFPYYYKNNSWHNAMSATEEFADEMLHQLANALNNPTVQPASSTSAVYAWFANLVAQNAIITNLFSKAITLLDPGYIKSSNYTPTSERDVCTYDISNVDCEGSFSVDANTFVNNTWGYGTYTITCTRAYKSNPHSSEGTDDGEWSISLNGVQKATTSDCAGLANYGIDIDFDGEGYVTSEDDYFTVTSVHETVSGQGFYLGSDGQFNAYSINISGDSYFAGSFNCDVIKTQVDRGTTASYNVPSASSLGTNMGAKQAYDLAKKMTDPVTSGGFGLIVGNLYSCSISGVTEVAFVKVTRSPRITTNTGAGRWRAYDAEVAFYDNEGGLVDLGNLSGFRLYRKYQSTVTSSGNSSSSLKSYDVVTEEFPSAGYCYYVSYYNPDGFTLTIYTGGNRLVINVPTSGSASTLTTGMLFVKAATEEVDGVQCHQVYMRD